MFPTVRQFTDSDTHAIGESADIHEAIRELIDDGITGAPVVDAQGHLVGMLSEFECLRLLTKEREGGPVSDFMVREIRTVSPDMDVYFVAGLFLAEPKERRFPVVEGERLIGVITRKDILRAVAAKG
jgi:CBS domain-containing protein